MTKPTPEQILEDQQHVDDPANHGIVRPHWLKMQERTLREHLRNNLRLPTKLCLDIMAEYTALRRKQRAQRIRSTQHDLAWQELLDPARVELANIRTMLSNARRNAREVAQARWNALCVYETAIASVIAKLREYQKAKELTPRMLVKEMRDKGLALPRKDGRHWSDFVPKSKYQEVCDLFAALPPNKRGKTKTPFERVTTPLWHDRQRAILNTALAKAQEMENMAMSAATSEEARVEIDARLYRTYVAINRLENMPIHTLLPQTWEELLN